MDLVLVTSVICITNNALSYTGTRSVYSHEERFEQMKHTIKTIREKIPSKIFIVECSNLPEYMTSYLVEHSDYFLNLYDTESVRNCTTGRSKSLGEGTMTIHALKHLDVKFKNLIKISGRYWLTENFDYHHFDNDRIVVRYHNKDTVYTSLYKLPYTSVATWITFLENSSEDMNNCVGYEQLFAKFLHTQDNINSLNPIGIGGYISVDGCFCSA
jgi:hypothetical protein